LQLAAAAHHQLLYLHVFLLLLCLRTHTHTHARTPYLPPLPRAGKLKILYSDMNFWRAEAPRLALFIGGVEFEDWRPSKEVRNELKAAGKLPFGQTPVLFVRCSVSNSNVQLSRGCYHRITRLKA
jgi:hypothetical protein